jgi:hypothetical protein
MRAGLVPFAVALGALVSAPVASAATPGHSPDGARYTLSLRFTRSAGGTLTGAEAIRFRNTSATPMTSVWLRTWANGPGGCARPRIRIAVTAPARRGADATGCTALEVVPAAAIAPGATSTIELRFRVTVPAANDRFGRSLGDYMVGNAIPLLAVSDARGLHIDEPYFGEGESFYSLASDWRATLRVPSDLAAATTGTTRSMTSAGGVRRLVISGS